MLYMILLIKKYHMRQIQREYSDMDDMIFFHEGTVRICGSLDMDEALGDCFVYLKRHIPLEMMELSVFESGHPAASGSCPGMLISTSPTISNGRSGCRRRPLTTSNRARKDRSDRYGKSVAALEGYGGRPGHPRCHRNRHGLGHPGGAAGVCEHSRPGRRGFTERHAHLLSLLHDPFAIACPTTCGTVRWSASRSFWPTTTATSTGSCTGSRETRSWGRTTA